MVHVNAFCLFAIITLSGYKLLEISNSNSAELVCPLPGYYTEF